MLLVIDNYDSFTYNLVQFLGELGAEMRVFRNDEITLDDIETNLRPEKIVISPGPGTPDDAGVSLDILRNLGERVPAARQITIVPEIEMPGHAQAAIAARVTRSGSSSTLVGAGLSARCIGAPAS